MEETAINFSLLSVREVQGATAINRRALRRLGRTPLSVDLNVRVVPDVDRSMISLVVSCSYIAVVGLIRTRVLACTAVSTFEVEKLAEHVTVQGEEVVLGGKLMMTLLGIAVGALRGIISVRTADTPLRFRPLPVIDLTALMCRISYGSALSSALPL
ncbi:MAG: hypothetical protein HDS65_01955 [Bacteroidales bacterium]|nr:hypothetical protein [Bacteroidales bacterium]